MEGSEADADTRRKSASSLHVDSAWLGAGSRRRSVPRQACHTVPYLRGRPPPECASRGPCVAPARSSPHRTAGRSGSRLSAPAAKHDTTCARTDGLIAALNRLAAVLDVPTLTDLSDENADPGFRHPVKKPQGRELTLKQRTFNKVIRGVHGIAERANALLTVTFKVLRRVSLDPGSITRIARAALVLLQLESGRTT